VPLTKPTLSNRAYPVRYQTQCHPPRRPLPSQPTPDERPGAKIRRFPTPLLLLLKAPTTTLPLPTLLQDEEGRRKVSQFLTREGFDYKKSFREKNPLNKKGKPKFQNVEVETELDAFFLFFQGLEQHLISKTNKYVKTKCNQWGYKLKITKKDLWNYWALFWTMGLLRFLNLKEYWKPKTHLDDLFGSDFFSNTMGI